MRATPASLEVKPIEPVSEPSACCARSLRSPSQRSAGCSEALKIVGDWRDVSSPRASGEKRRGSAPHAEAGWQLEHAVFPSADSRVSQNSVRPSAISGVSFIDTPSIRPNNVAASLRKCGSEIAVQATSPTKDNTASGGL